MRVRTSNRLEHIWYRNIDWGVRFPERYNLKQQLSLSGVLVLRQLTTKAEELAFLHGPDPGRFQPGFQGDVRGLFQQHGDG